jgi:tight adherence protein B
LNELSIIYAIVFCAVLLAVQGAYWFFTERRRSRGVINRRLMLAMQSANTHETYETLKRERWLIGLDSKHFAHFNEIVTQSGLRLDGKILIVSAFSLGVLFFMIFGFALGYGLLSFIIAVACCILSMLLFLVMARIRRIARFSEQLPDAIDVIVRGVRSGYPFIVALDLVAKEMSDPIGTEFGITSDEMNFGVATGIALEHLYRRVGHEDLLYLTMAVKIQSETGGNMAETLQRLSRLIRERAMLHLKVKSITAEGRLSSIFLTVFPFLMFGVVNLLSPNFYGGVIDSPLIGPALALGLVMLAVGNFMIYRMVNFKV